MGNASIILLVNEQNITLHSFYSFLEIKQRETLEADIECIVFTLPV